MLQLTKWRSFFCTIYQSLLWSHYESVTQNILLSFKLTTNVFVENQIYERVYATVPNQNKRSQNIDFRSCYVCHRKHAECEPWDEIGEKHKRALNTHSVVYCTLSKNINNLPYLSGRDLRGNLLSQSINFKEKLELCVNIDRTIAYHHVGNETNCATNYIVWYSNCITRYIHYIFC